MPTYPIELDLSGRTVVVVGLGAVGRRKAAGLVESGARVLGIDPRTEEAPPGVELRVESYGIRHLDGASLVFAAATPEVNREVVADARRLGLWVNSSSEPAEGDFLLPAVWRDGPLTLTVSTSGASPALASALRDRAVSALGPSAAGLTRLFAELRPEVLETIADPAVRKRLLSEAADPRWIEFFVSRGAETTRAALRAVLGLKHD
jgi:precorrin-2 dehydrogenase/sirohydrochlorin ferrochelatase